jgi:hypothetical protein
MPKCIVCNTSENIVHSGTDALMLGVLKAVERICYTCASTEKASKDQAYEELTKWYEGTLKK